MPIDNANEPNPMFKGGTPKPAGPPGLEKFMRNDKSEKPSLQAVTDLLQKAIDMLADLRTQEATVMENEPPVARLRPPMAPMQTKPTPAPPVA